MPYLRRDAIDTPVSGMSTGTCTGTGTGAGVGGAVTIAVLLLAASLSSAVSAAVVPGAGEGTFLLFFSDGSSIRITSTRINLTLLLLPHPPDEPPLNTFIFTVNCVLDTPLYASAAADTIRSAESQYEKKRMSGRGTGMKEVPAKESR
jgi:hypothetical protein